jgi:hypothetical protein
MVLPADGRLAPQAGEDLVLLPTLEHVEIEQVEIHPNSPSGPHIVTQDARVSGRPRQAGVRAIWEFRPHQL